MSMKLLLMPRSKIPPNRTKCPVLLIGSHSVMPSTIPSSRVLIKIITPIEPLLSVSSISNLCDIDQLQCSDICIFQGSNQCFCRIDCSQYIYACLNCISANQEPILRMFDSLSRNIDHQ